MALLPFFERLDFGFGVSSASLATSSAALRFLPPLTGFGVGAGAAEFPPVAFVIFLRALLADTFMLLTLVAPNSAVAFCQLMSEVFYSVISKKAR